MAGTDPRERSMGLQWSRFFSKRKIRRWRPDCRVLWRASMEPLFFKAENTWVVIRKEAEEVGLQWSRFFSKRKIGQDELAVTLLVASMEPLFFQSRKSPAGAGSRGAAGSGFNGAAFFQSGK